MKLKSKVTKVFMNLYIDQLKWSIWFVLTNIIIHVVMAIFAFLADTKLNNLFEFSMNPSFVYMLIIGVAAGFYFLPFYIKQGVTRKEYYIGSVLSAIAISVTLVVSFGVLSGVEKIIFNSLDYSFTSEAIIPNLNISWLQTLILYTINLFTYYLIGWLINVGFYRFKGLIGVLFVILAILALIIHGLLWVNGLFSILDDGFANIMSANPVYLSILGNAILIVILMFSIRLITKRVAIKL